MGKGAATIRKWPARHPLPPDDVTSVKTPFDDETGRGETRLSTSLTSFGTPIKTNHFKSTNAAANNDDDDDDNEDDFIAVDVHDGTPATIINAGSHDDDDDDDDDVVREIGAGRPLPRPPPRAWSSHRRRSRDEEEEEEEGTTKSSSLTSSDPAMSRDGKGMETDELSYL